MKRIICILTAITILLSGVFVFANPAYTGISGEVYEESANLLMNLGIMFPLEDKTFGADSKFTRTDAAVAIIRLLGYDEMTLPANAETECVFGDVEADYWAVEDINMAYNLGIISPDEENCFRPGDSITVAEFAKMLLCAFGYYTEATEAGGYPAGYLKMAARLDLLNGISDQSADKALNRGDAALIMNNALEAEVRIPIGYSDDSVRLKQQGTVLEVYLGMTKAQGVVQADFKTALSGHDVVDEGYVLIGDVLYKNGEFVSADAYLGHNVVYYYKKNGNIKELKYIKINDDMDDNVTFESQDDYVYRQAGKVYQYTNDNNRTKEYELADGFDVIYNNEVYNRCPVESMHPEVGYVEIIDNNGDKKYDVVKISEYTTHIFSRYSELANTIAFEDSTVMNLEDVEDLEVLNEFGESMELMEIPVAAVLSIALSNSGKRCTIIVYTETIEGAFSIMHEGKLKFGDVEYPVLDNIYIPDRENISLQDTGVFYLDFMGNIAAFISNNNFLRIGYMTKMAELGTFANKCIARIFTRDNQFNDYNFAEKVLINDESYKVATPDFYEAFGVADVNSMEDQLIRFKLNNEGEINYVETAQEEGDGLRITVNQETKIFYTTPLTFAGVHYVGNCGVFMVPTSGKEEYYRYTTGSRLGNKVSYTFSAYEFDDDLRTDFVVCFMKNDETNEISNDQNLMIFDNYEKMIDHQGKPYVKINVYEKCAPVEYYAINEDFISIIEGLKQGDVIQVKNGRDGYIIGLRKIYDADDNMGMVYGGPITGSSIMCGYIREVSGNIFRCVLSEKDTSQKDDFPGNSASVYNYYGALSVPDLTAFGGIYKTDVNIMVYDKSLPNGKRFYSVTKDELLNVVGNSVPHLVEGKAQFIVMKASTGNVKEIFVYK